MSPDQIDEIRVILEESSSEDESDAARDNDLPDSIKVTNLNDFNFMLHNLDSLKIEPRTCEHPPPNLKTDLCNVYHSMVDSVLKCTHEPSVRRFLQAGQSYLGYPQGHPVPEALAFAIYFVTVSSQSKELCQQRLGQRRAVLLPRYKLATEVCLARVNFVNATDMT